MSKVSANELIRTLGIEGGGMTLFIPEGRSCYYVFFRHRGRQISRSCGSSEYSQALVKAAEILADVVRTPALQKPGTTSIKKEAEVVRGPEIEIAEVLDLFNEWISTARPGERRPRAETAKNYQRRLKQLCKILKANSVSDLSQRLAGFSHSLAGMSEVNFGTMIRNASAVFATAPRAFFAVKNVQITDPFNGCIHVSPEQPHFESPSLAQLRDLKEKGTKELKVAHPREWLLLLLVLGSGMRVQEACHLRWQDVTTNGIQVRSSRDHRTKSGHGRFIRLSDELMSELEQYRKLPLDWVIPNGNFDQRPQTEKIPAIRCSRACRRLAGWLRAHGIPATRANHYMRKAFGSIVAQEHGIITASRYLGHSTTKITEQIYVGVVGSPIAHIL